MSRRACGPQSLFSRQGELNTPLIQPGQSRGDTKRLWQCQMCQDVIDGS